MRGLTQATLSPLSLEKTPFLLYQEDQVLVGNGEKLEKAMNWYVEDEGLEVDRRRNTVGGWSLCC